MTRALQGAHIREVMDLSNPLSITGSSKAPPVEAQCQVSAVSAEMGGYETSAAFAKAGKSDAPWFAVLAPAVDWPLEGNRADSWKILSHFACLKSGDHVPPPMNSC